MMTDDYSSSNMMTDDHSSSNMMMTDDNSSNMMPLQSSVDAQKEDKRYSEPCRRAVEEDDFTISSISDIDLSPV